MDKQQTFVKLERVQCDCCGSSNTSIKYKIDISDLLLQTQVIVPDNMEKYVYLVMCQECGLLYVNPRWVFPAGVMPYDIEAENQYFSSTYQIRRKSFSDLVQSIVLEMKPETWLDIGCGDGVLLEVCREAGINCEGFEISDNLVSNLRSRFGDKNIHSGSLENLPSETYQVVFLINVIEHLSEPSQTLQQIWRVLKPGGMVYIHAPNAGGLMARITGSHWHQIEPLVHLYYFNNRTLENLLVHSNLIPRGKFYLPSASSIKKVAQKFLYSLGLQIDNGLGIIAQKG